MPLGVETDAPHGFFTTTDLTPGQWPACAAVGSVTLWTSEVLEAVLRARARRARVATARH
ncbi:hypothetical protein WJ438_01175 [Streptomyces sp. GD-15H]|uniref:hypothetical protein n=1 Tax=Streptomyces sp. GD-15H TaxID=3129112 RepID=UPI00324F99AF